MSQKAVDAKRENPGSKLKLKSTAREDQRKPKRRKSFCSRIEKRLTSSKDLKMLNIRNSLRHRGKRLKVISKSCKSSYTKTN